MLIMRRPASRPSPGHRRRIASPQADLHDAGRIQQVFLDGPTDERGVIDPRTHEFVERVGMGVDLQHAERPVFGDGAQNGQRHDMVSADGDGRRRSCGSK